MSSATFVHASQTITYTRNPLRPDCSLDRIQPRETTAVDVPIVYDSLTKNDLIDLTLRLTDSELEQLQFFWLNTARGASNPFTYNNVVGTAYSVKFNQTQLAPSERAYNSHTVKVSLRVQ